MVAITKQCAGLGIKPPKKSAFTIETAPDFFKLHCLAIFSAKRGGGKTVACANLIRMCKENGYFDKVWVITPTYESNKEIWAICNTKESDILQPTADVLTNVKAMIEAEADEWDRFLQELKEWNKMRDDLRSGRDSSWSPDTLLGYADKGWLTDMQRPKWKYKEERPPRLGLVIDDCMGTDLLKPGSGLTRFCIAHRHWGRGLGISLFMLVQSYCSTAGLARPIREQCTLLFLWRLRDENQKRKLLEEADLGLTDEQFASISEYAWSKPFGFLTIDFAPKREDSRFRSGFEEIISP